MEYEYGHGLIFRSLVVAKLATILLVSYYSSYIAVTKSTIHYPGTKDL